MQKKSLSLLTSHHVFICLNKIVNLYWILSMSWKLCWYKDLVRSLLLISKNIPIRWLELKYHIWLVLKLLTKKQYSVCMCVCICVQCMSRCLDVLFKGYTCYQITCISLKSTIYYICISYVIYTIYYTVYIMYVFNELDTNFFLWKIDLKNKFKCKIWNLA